MRPPLNAGENGLPVALVFLGQLASMRPPLNAGENGLGAAGQIREGIASMRPPLNAGENRSSMVRVDCAAAASMRPPLNAGENAAAGSAATPRRSFNEAPAERGGKLGHPQFDVLSVHWLQ